MATDEYGVTTALLGPNKATASEIAGGIISLRVTDAWNRLNTSLVTTGPRRLRNAEAARRRIAKLR